MKMDKPEPQPAAAPTVPITPREWALHRGILHCKIACDAINGKNHDVWESQITNYALFNLVKALEEMLVALGHDEERRAGK